MQISTHPNSLLDSRWTSARQLTQRLGRPPTRAELSQQWGTTEARVHAILLTLRAHRAEIDVTPKSPSPALMDKKSTRLAEIEHLTEIYGRPPTRRELSVLWGVNRSRVGRVLHQIAQDQAKSRARLVHATIPPWLRSL